jgi:hypothetical protein
MGRFCARCKLGFDLSPRSIINVTDLGLLGAAIYVAILDRPSKYYAVTRTRRWMSLPAKLSRLPFVFRAINSCLLHGLAFGKQSLKNCRLVRFRLLRSSLLYYRCGYGVA